MRVKLEAVSSTFRKDTKDLIFGLIDSIDAEARGMSEERKTARQNEVRLLEIVSNVNAKLEVRKLEKIRLTKNKMIYLQRNFSMKDPDMRELNKELRKISLNALLK